MDNIDYLFYLSPEEEDRIRVEIYKRQDKILQFVVQYEIEIYNEWHPVVRYDTSHGFFHRDLLHPDGSKTKQPLYFETYKLALTYATQDLKQNWKLYRKRFEEELHE